MDEVRSLRDAKKWYRKNSGTLNCVNNKRSHCVNSFEEAEAFYRYGDEVFNAHNLLNKIIELEQQNEKAEQKVKQAQSNLLNDQVLISVSNTVNRTKEETIRIIQCAINSYNSAIQKNNEQIQGIIKNNPNVEPFYIMHRITK